MPCYAPISPITFFTARQPINHTCINALQSVLLAVLASRESEKTWVQTEHLDIHNYALIRLQYKEVTEKLKAMEGDVESSEEEDKHAQEPWYVELSSKKLWRGLKQR
eukprot:7583126-Ditylum_brightwellii.AAC.1